MKHKCPICHKTIKAKAEETKFYPFCSCRCKLVDLGVWLDAGYQIPQSQEPGEPSNIGNNVPLDRR